MAYTTENNYTGNGSTRLYSFTFPYLEDTDIKVTLNDTANTNFTLANATQIQFTADAGGETSTQAADGSPKNAVKIKIYRDTDISNLQSEFFSGSAIRAQDLNNDFNQTLYVSQETEKAVEGKWNDSTQTLDSTEAFVDSNDYIMTAAAIDDRIIAKQAARALADGKIIVGNGSGVGAQVTPSGDVTMANTGAFTIASGAVETSMIAADAINATRIADDAVDSEHIAADSIDTEHYAPGSVDSTAIADGTIVNTDISGSAAIAHSKLASLTDGRILVGNGSNVPVGVTVSGDVTLANTGAVTIATGAVEHAMLAGDAVDGDNIADDAVDSEHYVNGSIDAQHIADSNITTAKIADGNVTRAKLQADCINATKIEDDAIDSEHYTDGSIDTAHIADANVTLAKVENVTDGQIIVGNGSNRPTAVAVSGDVTIANTGAVTIANNAVEIGMIGCEQTTISDSDSHIPTSGAVVDYVAAQINPIGGLEVIADDESFPNTIPAAGVVISITDAAGLQINSSGVSTNGDTLDNSTVTINGFPSSLRGGVGNNADPYVLGSGAGLMVQSTGSSQTYNYHKALLKESDFVQLSDDINDFNNKYRIASSAPGSDNDEGDLYFNTSTNKMNVYDGSAWGEVTSTGDYKLLTIKDHDQASGGSGPTFNGSNEEFDLFDGSSDASINSVGQLLVVLNGVLQKPNSGTFSGSAEGFYLNDTHGIKFCDPPPSGSTLYVTQIGTATTVNVPADDSVTAAKIANGAVVAAGIGTGAVEHAKLANDAVDGDNLADNACDSEHYTDGSIDHVHLAADAVDGDNIADDSIDSEHYVNGSIDHAHLANDCVDGDNIADNSVGLAAMAGIARGKLIVGDSNGDPAYLAAGSNDQVLTMDANGDVGWEAAAGAVTALNNATANELVTVGSTTTELDAEAGLTFDGTHLSITDGNLVIGTSGHGIDFSADGDSTNASGTASGHLLHDYEEGTFDVTLPTGVTSYNTRSGHYTKVGQLVHFQLYFNATVDSTSNSNYAKVGGLPFACASGTNISVGVSIGWWYDLNEDCQIGYIAQAESDITLLGEDHNGSRDHVSHNDLFQSAGPRMCISGTYITTA